MGEMNTTNCVSEHVLQQSVTLYVWSHAHVEPACYVCML